MERGQPRSVIDVVLTEPGQLSGALQSPVTSEQCPELHPDPGWPLHDQTCFTQQHGTT